MFIRCFYSDVLSFYKEELDGETANFIHDRAAVANHDASIALSKVVDEVVASVRRIRALLKGKREKDTWEEFIKGYVAFHVYTPRYRILDLIGEEHVNPAMIR